MYSGSVCDGRPAAGIEPENHLAVEGQHIRTRGFDFGGGPARGPRRIAWHPGVNLWLRWGPIRLKKRWGGISCSALANALPARRFRKVRAAVSADHLLPCAIQCYTMSQPYSLRAIVRITITTRLNSKQRGADVERPSWHDTAVLQTPIESQRAQRGSMCLTLFPLDRDRSSSTRCRA